MQRLSGRAASEATRALAARNGEGRYRRLGRSALWVSQAGFGSYRVDAAVAAHKEALRAALQSGINLIDTSANYADGGSERLIGEVLTEMVSTGAVRRDEVVLISKVGYLQNSNLRLRQERQQAGKDFPEVVPYAPTLEHCIHPDFLEEQLELSLQRLQISCLDGFLLHNPEYYLLWALQQGGDAATARAEYVRRLRQAVSWLEKAVSKGVLLGMESAPTPFRGLQAIRSGRRWTNYGKRLLWPAVQGIILALFNFRATSWNRRRQCCQRGLRSGRC